MSDITIKNDYGTFKLIKNEAEYTKYWVCINGRSPGSLGRTSIGQIVPVGYNSEFHAMALASGYSQDELFMSKPPEKVKGSGEPRVFKGKDGISIRVMIKPKIGVSVKAA